MTSPPPWQNWPLGIRVVIRRHVAGGGFSDVLGTVLYYDDDAALLETRTGQVRVSAAEVAVAKRVGPPPGPRRPFT